MIALDTNILVHAHRRDASLHEIAIERVKELAESPAPWAICYHSLIEFYGIATHAKLWKTPSSPSQALDQIRAWQESPSLRILTDNQAGLETLGELLIRGEVRGALVHDARIAACCLCHGVRELWSVDRDFSRFPDLRVRNPLI